MANIVEVANLAGVSKSTVSRVINKSASVKPNIASLVEDAIRQIGYQPPLRRRGRKASSYGSRGLRTRNIALVSMQYEVVQLYRMPVMPMLLQSLELSVAEHELKLVLASIHEDGQIPPALAGNDVDGMLIVGQAKTPLPAALLARMRQIPGVWLMRAHSDPGRVFDHVEYNNASVGAIAGWYLQGRGHSHAAFLNSLSLHPAFGQRRVDFARVVKEGGATVEIFEPLGPDADLHSGNLETIQVLVDRLIATTPRPTGIFVPNDAQVPAIYHAFKTRGLLPQRDFDLISCDNDMRALEQLTPRPATIDLGLEQIGKRGVQQLLWRLRNPDYKHRMTIALEPFLVEP